MNRYCNDEYLRAAAQAGRARREGRTARQMGKLASACPYESLSDAGTHWLEAYEDEDTAIRMKLIKGKETRQWADYPSL